MYMRDLACCAGGKAYYSMPSDLVHFVLATKADSVDGELAGGSVMSLMTRRDNGIVDASDGARLFWPRQRHWRRPSPRAVRW